MSIYRGDVKKIVRTKMVRTPTKTPAKIAVFMPAEECLCIKEALWQGTIDRNTTIIAIDRSRYTCQIIREVLTESGFENFFIINRQLKNASKLLYKYGKGKIDYAFFDCCGEFTEDTADMLCQKKLFAKTAYVAFTFMAFSRHWATTHFLDQTYRTMKENKEHVAIPKGCTVLPMYEDNDAQTKTVNAILYNMWSNYNDSKLTKFEGYRRKPKGRCVSMFSAQFQVK